MVPSADAPLRVVLADAHAVVREGLPHLLREHGVVVVAATATASEAGVAIADLQPHVALVAANLPDASELEPLGRRLARDTPLVLYVDSERDRDLGDRHGAPLVATKTGRVGELARLLRGVVVEPRARAEPSALTPPRARSQGLTHAELRVLARVAAGDSTLAAAAALGLSPHTVRTHVRNALQKLGVSNRAHAIAIAVAEAAIPSPAKTY